MSVSERIKLGAPERLREDPELPYTFDGTHCTLRQKDGSIMFWETDLGNKPYFFMYRGDAEYPFRESAGSFKWDPNGYPFVEDWPSGMWVQSFYMHSDGTLVGFVHREKYHFRDEKKSIFDFYTGLAISVDGGYSWKYVGDVLSNPLNDGKHCPNMGGVPFFVVDDRFQFFYNEHPAEGKGYVSAARCEVEETVAALKAGRLPKVVKYGGEGLWNVDGMTGVGADILPVDGWHHDSHADAAWCPALGRYLLTIQTGVNSELLMYLSADGERFDECVKLCPKSEPGYFYSYSTFVGISDDSSDDMSVIGRDFYIYYTHKEAKRYDNDTLMRVRVTVV